MLPAGTFRIVATPYGVIFSAKLPVPAGYLLIWALAAVGCAAHAGPAPTHPPRAEQPVLVARQVITPHQTTSIDELYEEARTSLDAQEYATAWQKFDRVYQLDPRGPRAEQALFFAGTASDLGSEPVRALRTYESFASLFPDAPLAREALLRSVRLYVFLEQWERAGVVADRVQARYDDLRPFEWITLHGAKALSLVARGEDQKASYYVEKARTIIEENGFDAAGQVPRDLAQVYYALGEIRRLRAERIKFVPVPANFGQVLEERCQLLLNAQSSYSDAMRAHDAHWSAMAGFRVGELYQRLHEDLMQVPAPTAADSQSRELLFEGAMRLRYSILLEKAQSMMDHTLKMAARTNEKSAWVARAERALHDLEQAVVREHAALNALPYTRLELQQALDDLAARSTSTSP